jgi:hypothetical protein
MLHDVTRWQGSWNEQYGDTSERMMVCATATSFNSVGVVNISTKF